MHNTATVHARHVVGEIGQGIDEFVSDAIISSHLAPAPDREHASFVDVPQRPRRLWGL